MASPARLREGLPAGPGRPTGAERAGVAALVPAAALTAVLAAVAGRPWGLGALALAAYAPACLALLRARRARHGAVVAATASLGAASVAYEAAQGLFPGGHLVVALAACLPHAPAGALAVRLRRSLERRLSPAGASALTLAALPSLWSAAEWLPSRPELLGPYALPLAFIGYSQADLPTAQVARLGSVAAVSHLVLLANCCLAAAVLAARHAARVRPALRRRALAAATGLLALGGAGPAGAPVASHHLAAPPSGSTAGAAGLVVEVVQPNLPDSAYFAASRSPGARAWLLARIAALASGEADLTVLPEAAWPGTVDASSAAEPAAEAGAAWGDLGAVLFGAPAAGFVGAGARTNSAFLLAGGELVHVYAKRRPVPIAEDGFAAGPGPGLTSVAGVPLAVFVCYDVLFPSDARAAVRAGARLLVVITDDAFAAGSDVPELHLTVARLRAVETGVPVVVAANTGPSAVVLPSGRVAARLPPLAAGALRAVVVPGDGDTPYVAVGEWLGAANAILTGGLAAVLRRGGTAHKGPA